MEAGPPVELAWRRAARQAAAAALLMAAVACTVYVAAQDGGAAGTIAALAGAPARGGQAALEHQLAATKAKLAHEASIISSLKAKEGQFRAAFKQAGTSSLASAATTQLDDEGGEDEGAEEEGDGARQKEELEKQEASHFNAREAAVVNALTHEGEMKPSDAKWLKWKAAHELYEQAAYKDISGEEHNRTEAEPEAEVLTSKYAETAAKLDGVAGYNNLLAEANQTDAERMKQWDAYLATQKNRTSLFPLVDKTQGVTITWPGDEPADELKAGKGAASLHAQHTANLHQRVSTPAASQTLHVGEQVEAVDSFLFDKGGVLPMRAGEKATILKVNTTSGVDTIITTSGKQGTFPASDLAPQTGGDRRGSTEHLAKRAQASPEESAVPKAPGHLHLPPAIKGNVVDVAVQEGERTFAAQLARERERSRIQRSKKQSAHAGADAARATDKKDRSSLKQQAEAEERAKAAANAQSVVSDAIFQANSRFEQAKQAEIQRSEAARQQHKKDLQMVRAEHSLGANAVRQGAAPIAAAREEKPPVVATAVSTKVDTGGMSPALAAAAKAAEATFDKQLEKAVKKESAAAPSDKPADASGMSPEIQAAVAAAEAEFDKKMGASSGHKTGGKQAAAAGHHSLDEKIEQFDKKMAAGETKAKAGSAKAVQPKGDAATNKKLSPGLQAAVKAAETTFDRKVTKRAAASAPAMAATQSKAAAPGPAPAGTQSQAARPAGAAQSVAQKREVEDRRARNAVTLGLETARAAYTEAKAREESRSLKKRTLASQLKMREVRVAEATATVRALRDALAREEDSNKHKLVAKELSQQANYIGDGIVEEEAFSSAAHKGEVVHSVQEQGAHAASKHSARLAHSSAASAAAKGRYVRGLYCVVLCCVCVCVCVCVCMPAEWLFWHAIAAVGLHAPAAHQQGLTRKPRHPQPFGSSGSSRAHGQERSLVAKALQERAAAGREERQWQAQQLKENEMQEEEQAAVRSANTMFDRHMAPLRDVSKTYSNYEHKLLR